MTKREASLIISPGLAMGPTRHAPFICPFTYGWYLCYLQLALLGLFQDMTEPV